MKHLIEAPQELPVLDRYDVLVAGGGVAGVCAAVSAARNGARTAIVERYGYPGGLATGGMVMLIVGLTDGNRRIINGLCGEIIERLHKINRAQNVGNHVLFDTESMKLILDAMIEENNITPYYHSYIYNAIKSENRALGAIIDGKSGRQVLEADVFVDATGDADLAKYCNIPFYKNLSPMPVTLGFRAGGIDITKAKKYTDEHNNEFKALLDSLGIPTGIGGWIWSLNKNEAWLNISNIENIDGTSVLDLTRAEIQGRKQIFKIMENFKKHIPGFEEAYLIDSAPQIGVRESRRVKGLYCFTKDDINKKFDDTIALAPNYTGSTTGSVELPYRCLISEKIENVIFAGRCISVESELLDMFREIPCCMATGQAAGTAAALAVESGIHKIGRTKLRDMLRNQGVILN